MKIIAQRDRLGRIAKGNNKSHGMSDSPIYDCWVAMKARCENSKNPQYKNYGGRGVSVCAEWADNFPQFLLDMGEKPSPLHTIDRIDVNGNYEKANCRWVTIQEQQMNRRDNTKTPGVEFRHNKYWLARIVYKGKRISLGWFSTLEDAMEARKAAELKYWQCT